MQRERESVALSHCPIHNLFNLSFLTPPSLPPTIPAFLSLLLPSIIFTFLSSLNPDFMLPLFSLSVCTKVELMNDTVCHQFLSPHTHTIYFVVWLVNHNLWFSFWRPVNCSCVSLLNEHLMFLIICMLADIIQNTGDSRWLTVFVILRLCFTNTAHQL